MYISRHGYISPVWSRELTLKFMKIADDENWICLSMTTRTIRNLPEA